MNETAVHKGEIVSGVVKTYNHMEHLYKQIKA